MPTYNFPAIECQTLYLSATTQHLASTTQLRQQTTMATLFKIPVRPNEALPPFIIVHLIHHGRQSTYGVGNPLTPAGTQQCTTFARQFRPHVRYITHIISSPLLRASETSYTALGEVIDGGVYVSIMDQ
ncbi:hypothetical protein IFR05_012769, partial [Cadophora sp. M221]